MFFQKKGAKAVKKDKAHKKGKQVEVAEVRDLDMLDMDDSEGSEEVEVQKTPSNKTPKGRQSLSTKKISLDLSVNKNKNAKKDTSLVAKMFSPQDADSEEEDEEEDPDFEVGAIDLEEDDDLDSELGDSDEEDDSDEEEDEPIIVKAQKNMKNQTNVQNKQKTPVKGVDKPNGVKTPKGAQTTKAGQTPKSDIKMATQKSSDSEDDDDEDDDLDLELDHSDEGEEEQKNVKSQGNKKIQKSVQKAEKPAKAKCSKYQEVEVERRRIRDLRSLYVKGLPQDTTIAELKILSPDILDALLGGPCKSRFALLFFASEARAEANYKLLQSKKFRGQPLDVDFAGEKSTNEKVRDVNRHFNPKKLCVGGIPLECTLADVAKYFPKACVITFENNFYARRALIKYFNEDDANEDFNANAEIDIKGCKLMVLHYVIPKSLRSKANMKKVMKRRAMKQGGPPSKEMKMQ